MATLPLPSLSVNPLDTGQSRQRQIQVNAFLRVVAAFLDDPYIPVITADPTDSPTTNGFVRFNKTTGILWIWNGTVWVATNVASTCNANSSAQSAAAANTYITGSALTIPSTAPTTTTCFSWRIWVSKNATGTSAPIFTVVFGTNGTTADTARLTFTFAATTAATDSALVEIDVVVTTAGASGVITGSARLIKTSTGTTGFSGVATQVQQIVATASAAFDLTVANSIIGVCVNPGAGTYTLGPVIARMDRQS